MNHMSEYEIRQALKGVSASSTDEPSRPKKKRSSERSRPALGQNGSSRLPTAGPNASEAAQRWMDLAESRGLAMPFNANWLALQIETRVNRDPEMLVYLRLAHKAEAAGDGAKAAGYVDQVRRWNIKMAEKFWDEWVAVEDRPADISHLYLDQCWDDVRDYARDCLRAAYLKEHGRRIPPTWNREEEPAEPALQEELRRIKTSQWAEEVLADDTPSPRPLDETRREALRSFREREKIRSTNDHEEQK